MKIEEVVIPMEAEGAILNLAMKVSLDSGLNFNTSKSNDLLNLLKFAQQSNESAVKEAFQKLSKASSPDLCVKFRNFGVDINPTSVPITHLNHDNSASDNSQGSNRTRMYRGQQIKVS